MMLKTQGGRKLIPNNLSKRDILLALDELKKMKDFPPSRKSTNFDLLYEGKRFPPKYVISLANRYARGYELSSNDFNGGEETNSFLEKLGFEICTKDWDEDEVEAIVKDYFSMLSLELHGQKYNKAEHNKNLQNALKGRSRGSIEFKHQNISAVLRDMGLPYIEGYKPRSNYQAILIDAIKSYIALYNFTTIADETPKMGEQEQLELVIDNTDKEVPPPEAEPGTEKKASSKNVVKDYNWAEREQKNHALGEAGEEFVVQCERNRLSILGLRELAEKVERVSKTRGDGLGYDVLSFNDDGSECYIEVKTTRGGKKTPFFFSHSELEFSEEKGENYILYRVFHFDGDRKFFRLMGALSKACNIKPTHYRGFF